MGTQNIDTQNADAQLNEASLSALLAQTNPKQSLPARFYTDTQLYRYIQDKLFMHSWQYAAHLSQLQAIGDYLCFTIADQDLMLIRQSSDNIACFYNVCQHRGHILLEGAGNLKSITCPYHAWTYNLDGKLRGAPNSHKVEGFIKSEICLSAVRIEIFCGLIFVNLDDNAPSMDESFPKVKEAIYAHCPEIETCQFAYGHQAHEYCNWLLAVENYNECYHCPHAHPTFASGVIDPQSYQILPLGAGKCLNHRAGAARGKDAWYDTSGSDYASFFLFPGFSLQIYPSGVVNSYHWRPVSVDDTIVHRSWYSQTGEVDDVLEKIIELDETTTFTEDLRLVKNVQRGLSSKGYRPGPLILDPAQKINSEHPVASLHAWLKEVIAP